MKLSLLTACLWATVSASSLRGDRKLARDRSYSLAKSGGGASRAGNASAQSALASSVHDMVNSIIASTDPSPSDLVVGTEDDLFLGYSVSYAGDFNGDGYDDIIVGGPQKNRDDASLQVGAAFVVFGRKGGLPDLASIDSLDGTNGFAFFGGVIDDDVGFAVSHAGDVNGDGFDDVIIGAPNVDGGSIDGAGEAYVIFGTDTPLPPTIDAQYLDGNTGFTIQGNAMQDHLGSSVSAAGDVNGDGIDDIIVGAPNAGFGGEAYVIFGAQTSNFPEIFFITDIDGSNGYIIASKEDAWLGLSVAAAGDVNGDGIGDILVGAPQTEDFDGNSVGATYVVYGTTATVQTVAVNSLTGSDGYQILGKYAANHFGSSLAGVGDVNGDGIDDFVVGCPQCSPQQDQPYNAGGAYIFYGISGGSLKAAIPAEAADSILWGKEVFDSLGVDVSSAGDVNGDGINDIVVAASRSVTTQAILCVVYGSANGIQQSLEYEDINNTDQGMIVDVFHDAETRNDRVMSVSNAGDFNGDGVQDIVIGLPNVRANINSVFSEGHVKVLVVNPLQF